MSYNESNVSPHWEGFRKLWWIIAILLFLFLLITFLMGYGPGGKQCQVPAKERIVEKLITAPDTVSPLITLNNDSVLHLTTGSSYTEYGAKAVDGRDGVLTVTTTGDVDTSKAGEYMVTYKVTDAAGNSTSETRKIVVTDPIDSSVPKITLNGDSVVNLMTGDIYSEAGAKAIDDVDGEIAVDVTGNVDTAKVGEYIVTYTATDKKGNTASETRKVIVSNHPDTTPPTIHMKGDSVVKLMTGDTFTDAGATATDNVDGDITVTTSGIVNMSKAGEYLITYTATDAKGNSTSETRKIIVAKPIDTTAPVITLMGDNIVQLMTGDTYSEAGSKAYDNMDGKITVETEGNVDTNTAGEYIVTYSATDSAGNRSSETRMVIVSKKPAPVVEAKPVSRLYFGLNKDNNPSDTEYPLNTVISYLKSHPDSVALVSGFHDPSGDYAYNQNLANRRANTVVAILRSAGIPAQQISIQQPVETTGTGTRSEARRVEVMVR